MLVFPGLDLASQCMLRDCVSKASRSAADHFVVLRVVGSLAIYRGNGLGSLESLIITQSWMRVHCLKLGLTPRDRPGLSGPHVSYFLLSTNE